VTDDLLELGRFSNLKAARARQIIGDIMTAVGQWPELARQAGVAAAKVREVERHFRRSLA